jgi:hypothetical protein
MAELLVRAVSSTSNDPLDPNENLRGCYKAGDVIGVAPNGWNWGQAELCIGGMFYVVKITDVTRQQVINWVRNNWTCEIEGIDTINGRRRRVRIDIDLVPLAVRNTLATTGQYTTTWAAIREYVRNKITNQTANGSPIE